MSNSSFQVISPRYPARDECNFYHAIALPGEGEVVAEWDLRPATADYLGHVEFSGRSVLEVGPASGFLSFTMERAGATVTCLEPSMAHLWDFVPFEGFDKEGWVKSFTPKIEGVRNAFWYCHALEKSAVRMIEADPYNIPAEIGDYDIGLLGSLLLHCRAPFTLLEQVARRVRQTIIVTDAYNPALGPEPVMQLLAHRGVPQIHTWWQFNPQFFVSALGLLGFTEVRIGFHEQQQVEVGQTVSMFTVVASRPAVPLERVSG